jgi:hypothetical protein
MRGSPCLVKDLAGDHRLRSYDPLPFHPSLLPTTTHWPERCKLKAPAVRRRRTTTRVRLCRSIPAYDRRRLQRGAASRALLSGSHDDLPSVRYYRSLDSVGANRAVSPASNFVCAWEICDLFHWHRPLFIGMDAGRSAPVVRILRN